MTLSVGAAACQPPAVRRKGQRGYFLRPLETSPLLAARQVPYHHAHEFRRFIRARGGQQLAVEGKRQRGGGRDGKRKEAPHVPPAGVPYLHQSVTGGRCEQCAV